MMEWRSYGGYCWDESSEMQIINLAILISVKDSWCPVTCTPLDSAGLFVWTCSMWTNCWCSWSGPTKGQQKDLKVKVFTLFCWGHFEHFPWSWSSFHRSVGSKSPTANSMCRRRLCWELQNVSLESILSAAGSFCVSSSDVLTFFSDTRI